MKLLPTNLRKLADLCAKESGRYDAHGVQVQFNDDGTYRVCATDCKIAALISGPCEDEKEYPSIPALGSAPNGQTKAIIPAKAFANALKAPKSSKPILSGHAAVVIGDGVTTFATTNLAETAVNPTVNLVGRFPPVEMAVPNGEPAARVRVDPKLLAKLLTVAAATVCDDFDQGVYLEIRKSTVPIKVTADNPFTGQSFVGIIMPLSGPEQPQDREPAETETAAA